MSVCILHRDGWGVTDSRTNFNQTGIFPDIAIKAMMVNNHIITCAGDSLINQRIFKIARENTEGEMLDRMIECLEDKEVDAHFMMVNIRREMIHVDGHGACSVMDPKLVDYWAIGCAADRVLGYLDRVAEDRAVTVEDAEKAVKRAALFDSGIDARCQVYRLV